MTPAEIISGRQLRGAKLKKLRLLKGVTKTYVSTITGLARQTITSIETGQECWNIDSEIIYLDGVRRKKPAPGTIRSINKKEINA